MDFSSISFFFSFFFFFPVANQYFIIFSFLSFLFSFILFLSLLLLFPFSLFLFPQPPSFFSYDLKKKEKKNPAKEFSETLNFCKIWQKTEKLDSASHNVISFLQICFIKQIFVFMNLKIHKNINLFIYFPYWFCILTKVFK